MKSYMKYNKAKKEKKVWNTGGAIFPTGGAPPVKQLKMSWLSVVVDGSY